jgi:hypothetical protein
MSEDKVRYKAGDTFDCQVRVVFVDADEEGEVHLVVPDVGEIAGYFTTEEMDVMFDPTYEERMKQQRIKELELELINLKGESK